MVFPPFEHLQTGSAEEVVRWALDAFGTRLAIVTSFQDEGMVVLDMAARLAPSIRVVTLDTGRLPPETFDMMEMVRARYGVSIEAVSPNGTEVERMVTRWGPNLFYESLANRTLCCHLRKVRPLAEKLAHFDAYTVGLRRSQSSSRADVQKVAVEDDRLKISPLADWSSADVRTYVERFDVPRHPLYAKGYPSIGCAPCTRAIEPGEGERDGRWWWEHGSSKECGLHFSPEGRVERTFDVLLRDVLHGESVGRID